MSNLRFEWDDRKNSTNVQKHGIRFEEAKSVFLDDLAILREDERADGEERFVLIGLSAERGTLVVCHCYREGDAVIRIISARRANRSERADYERRWSR